MKEITVMEHSRYLYRYITSRNNENLLNNYLELKKRFEFESDFNRRMTILQQMIDLVSGSERDDFLEFAEEIASKWENSYSRIRDLRKQLPHERGNETLSSNRTSLDSVCTKLLNISLTEVDSMSVEAKYAALDKTGYFQSEITKACEKPGYKIFLRSATTKAYYIALEIAKRAKSHYVVVAENENDDSVNHIIIFEEHQFQNLMLLHTRISERARLNEWGWSLYGVPIQLIAEMCVGAPRYNKHFCLNMVQVNDEGLVKAASEVIQIMMEKHGFVSEQELSLYLRHKYMNPIQNAFEAVERRVNQYYWVDYDNRRTTTNRFSKEELQQIRITRKIEYDQIYSNLVASGQAPLKWQQEHKMFEVVKSIFSDALFQHYALWISPQNYDVYVPSKNLAFEYQGLQHYESVEFFGGNEALNRRILLDRRKRELSSASGTTLIEWKYDELVNLVTLKRKLHECGVEK